MGSAAHRAGRYRQGSDVQLVADAIPALVWSAHSNGSADFFNQRWLEYTGLSLDQALDCGWKLAVHPDDLPNILAAFEEDVSSGKPIEVEGRFRRHDAQFRRFLVRGNPLFDDSGRIAKWFATNIDLEDLKRTEDTLRDIEEGFRLIVDGISGLVAIMTPTGEVEIALQ